MRICRERLGEAGQRAAKEERETDGGGFWEAGWWSGRWPEAGGGGVEAGEGRVAFRTRVIRVFLWYLEYTSIVFVGNIIDLYKIINLCSFTPRINYHYYRYDHCKRPITAGSNQTSGDSLSPPV